MGAWASSAKVHWAQRINFIYTGMGSDKPELREAKARLSREFHRRVSQAILDRDSSMQEAIEQGLRLWLANREAEKRAVVEVVVTDTTGYTEITDPEREWLVSLCRDVIYSDHPIAGLALSTNAITFHSLLDNLSTTNDPDTVARVERIRAENQRIRNAIERLRKESERPDNDVQGRKKQF